VCLAGASVIKTATSLGVPRAAVSKVMMAYTNHGKTSLAKKNRGRNPQLSERDCQALMTNVSKNYRTTAAKVKAEPNIYLEDPVSNKTV
jgi:transposase